MSRKTLLMLIAMNVLWAGTYSATKVLMGKAPFFVITTLRYACAALPMLFIASRQGGLRMGLRDFALCAVMGVATFSACPWLMYAGVELSRASDAAILTSTEPLLASLGAWIFLREHLDRRVAIGLVLAFGGAAVLSEFWRGEGAVNPVGTALIIGGVCFEAFYSVIGKSLLRREGPLKITAVALLAACVVNLSIVGARGQWVYARALGAADWLLLAGYLALICTVVGYTFWFVALREGAVANVAVTIFVQPVAGILVAWAWVHETPTATQIAGAAIVLVAVAVSVTAHRAPDPVISG